MVAFSDPLAIGKITTAEDVITIQRADQTMQLNEGDFIYLDDVITAGQTAVGIAFADETTMSVDPNSTMVIDDFVYDPENPTTGSMNANILEGNFSFVSGQIAKVGNDAMTVTTPVLTIGVRGTQVAGKANTEGEDNEIVLLPNNDGTVGQIMIANQSGEVLLTKPYEATIIANAYVAPTVPVVLPKAEVLKKFAATISTTRKTEAKAEVERDTEEAVREKEKAEDEQEELEEEKEELEEEAEALEEEKEELEENIEELEEEAEEAEKEAEELEEKVEEALEEKQEAEDKKEEVAEEIEQLEEELAEASTQEKQAIEQELEKLEEEFEEIAEEVAEIEKEIEVVEEKKKVVDKKVEQIEKDFVEAKEDFVEVEQKAEIVEKEVQQVIEQELVIEQEIKMVEQKFEAIVEKFEVFQKDFAIEFQDFIPEAEIQQFIEEAPEELIEEFKENIVEQLEKENEIIRIEKEVEEKEVEEKSEEDPFSEENVEEKMEEIQEEISELEQRDQELREQGEELQEINEEINAEREELERESEEINEKGKALDEKNRELEEREQQAIEDGDREALEELQQEFEALDKEVDDLNEKGRELDKGFDQVNEKYNELNEEYQEMSESYQELNEDYENYDHAMENNNYTDKKEENLDEMLKYDMEKFDVAEEDQVLVNVDDFIAEQKAEAIENNVYAQEADDFFNSDEVMVNSVISTQVQDLIITNFQYLDEYVNGFGANVDTVDQYNANGQDNEAWQTVDNNQELYMLQLEADYWFDMWVADQVAQDINVAPWLQLEGDVTKAEATAVDSMLFHFGGSDANGDRLTYSIFDDPTGRLRIEGQNVYLDQSFSVTEDTTYQIILKVQDPYGASDVDHIYLTVENNHSPEISNTSAVSLAENVSVGEDIATMYASDAEGEAKTWSITAGNDSNLFTINSSTGLIETAAALDYETATSHTLTITATDAFGNTSTVNQVVNVTDVAEATQYTKGISNTSIDAWGADYSHDMMLNNAWTNPKLLILGVGHGGSDVSNTSTIAAHSDVGYTVTSANSTMANYTLKSLSEYSMILDLNYNATSMANEQLVYDVLQAGKTYMMVGDHSGWDNKANMLIEDVADHIDSDVNTSNHTSMAHGLVCSGTEAHTIQAEYNVSTYGANDSGSYASTRGDGHACVGIFHSEHMGSGDLIAVRDDDNTEGFIAEWSREDSDASYHGAFIGHLDGNAMQSNYDGDGRVIADLLKWGLEQNEDAMIESGGAGIVVDSEYLPIFGDSYGTATHTAQNDITAIEAINLGNNVYIGGGMDHIDLVWDDSADAAYWAFNADMDNGATPTLADDHYGVIGYDRDGDGDLWETTDTFDLDKIKILDDSDDYLTQDSDATGEYYFKVTPVTYANNTWTVETDNTVTLANATDYNGYLDLSSNTDFDNINYALIETESALISEVIVSA
jgi:hypothetical protein